MFEEKEIPSDFQEQEFGKTRPSHMAGGRKY